jgi:hypothetical protein
MEDQADDGFALASTADNTTVSFETYEEETAKRVHFLQAQLAVVDR